jgi:hypothetical protein
MHDHDKRNGIDSHQDYILDITPFQNLTPPRGNPSEEYRTILLPRLDASISTSPSLCIPSIRLNILIAKRALTGIHNLGNRAVRKHTKNVQHMIHRRLVPRIAWNWRWVRAGKERKAISEIAGESIGNRLTTNLLAVAGKTRTYRQA